MYALASHRRSIEALKLRLEQRTGRRFYILTTPRQLNPDQLESYDVRTIFFPHWSHKIPASIHERFECVIFHMTDLPYGRGGSPLQNLVVRGHENTQISALRCVEELDAGPVYLKRPLNLNGSAEEIFLRADRIIESMIVEIIDNKPTPKPQTGKPTTFKRRRPEQSDWSKAEDLDAVFDHIRMLDAEGYPPAFIDIGPFRVTFSRASRRLDCVQADACIELRAQELKTDEDR